jgi:cytochrome c-type biogenesis protein CcmH
VTIVFFICAAVMAIALVSWAVMPLLRQGRAGGAVRRAAANRAVYQDQLGQLDGDLRAGTLSQSQYDEARREIDQRVVREVAEQPAAVQASRHRGRTAALAIAAMVPLVAGALYWRLGNPGAIGQAASLAAGMQEDATPQIEAIVQRLEADLEQNPGQAETWIMLARSYYHMRRFEQSSRAYARAAEYRAEDADLLADYADALAMSKGRRFEGKPLELVHRALKLNPGQWKALAMAGTAAFERGDYNSALVYWTRLKALAPPDSELSRSMSGNIAEARRLADADPGGSKKPVAADR